MKTAALFLLLCLLLGGSAFAVNVSEEQAAAIGTEELRAALPEEAEELLGDVSLTETLDADGVLGRILAWAKEQASEFLRSGVKSAAVILGILLLCAAAEVFAPESALHYVEFGGALGIAAAAVEDVRSFIGLGTQTLHSLSDFSKALLPTMAAAATASGAVTSGAAKYAATALFFDLLLTAANVVVMPAVYAYLATVVAKAALGNDALSGVASFLKWLAGTLITLLMLGFTCYLSLTGVISGTVDAATSRLTKTAISTALPVVGGIISDAAGTLVAGAGILRNTVGVFGLLAVFCVCLSPFLRLGVQYLTYKAVAGLAGVVSSKRLQGLVSGVGTAYGMVMGLVGAGGLMLFFSIVSSVRTVTGL